MPSAPRTDAIMRVQFAWYNDRLRAVALLNGASEPVTIITAADGKQLDPSEFRKCTLDPRFGSFVVP